MAARYMEKIFSNKFFLIVQREYFTSNIELDVLNLSLRQIRASKIGKNQFFCVFDGPKLSAPLWAHEFFFLNW